MTEHTRHRAVRKKYHRIETIEALQTHLQWAVCVELSTIPPYLAALYTIQDDTADVARLVRSVVFEEMLHMMLASNLMNAIGASPKLAGAYAPEYPGFMRHHAAGGPFIQLQAYSPSLMNVTFMAIEQPEASPNVPAEGDDFETIGQFYKAIDEGFVHCVEKFGESGVFGKDTGFQANDTYFGLGGGRLFEIRNLADAQAAIREIVQQGEGAPWPQPLASGYEPYGAKDYYGDRPDGTFGPILGTPLEMSHYAKFRALAESASQPSVWPMAANPDTQRLKGWVRELSELFDNSYAGVLSSLEGALGSTETRRLFFGVAFPLMQFAMAPLASLLVATPLQLDADPSLGPNAGPGFRNTPVPIATMLNRVTALLSRRQLVQAARGGEYANTFEATLEGVRTTLQGVERVSSEAAASTFTEREEETR